MTATIVRENLVIRAGATFAHVFTWTTTAGVAVDLTGYTATLTIEDSTGATVATLTSGSGLTLGGTAGTVTVAIAASSTATYTPGWGNHYSLVLVSGSTKTPLMARGHVSIEAVPGL